MDNGIKGNEMNNNIWSPKIGNATKQACCKIPYKGYEISIAMDDSCGCLTTLSRSDIRVFRDWDSKDVTEDFYKADSTCVANAKNLQYIFSMIDMFGDRD
jgi:hypothetical protein